MKFYNEFKYWFYPAIKKSNELNRRIWRVVPTSNSDMETIFLDETRIICLDCNSSEHVQFEILTNFKEFKDERPEYYLHPYDFGIILDTLDNMKDKYDALFIACVIMVDVTNDEKLYNKAMKALNWLNTTNFYITPASTRFHESYEYGLLEHTLKVVKNIVDLYSIPKFSEVKLYEAIQVALIHDFCKIGKYVQDFRWQKDENNNWEQVPYYKYSEDIQVPFGHGTASMYIAENIIKLTMEQKVAVRWHMGRWYVADSDINDLQYANENYPLVHMLQFADQLAITNY